MTMRGAHDKTARKIEVILNGASAGKRRIGANELRSLYDQASWWPDRALQDIDRMLDSGISVGALHDGKLVGFARAVSDGLFRAYIEDVVVDAASAGAKRDRKEPWQEGVVYCWGRSQLFAAGVAQVGKLGLGVSSTIASQGCWQPMMTWEREVWLR